MLVSVRFRDSVYRETGHTIMNLLAVSTTAAGGSHHVKLSILNQPADVCNKTEKLKTFNILV